MYRDFDELMHGQKVFTVQDDFIRWDKEFITSAIVTATEYKHKKGQSGEMQILQIVGDARVFVANVAVYPGHVRIRVRVDWDEDIPVHVSIHLIRFKLRPS